MAGVPIDGVDIDGVDTEHGECMPATIGAVAGKHPVTKHTVTKFE